MKKLSNKEQTSQEIKKQINVNVKKALDIIEQNKKNNTKDNEGEER